MKHAIDPTIDCVFKAILGSNEHINLLLHFINAVCQNDFVAPVSNLTIMNPYNDKDFLTDKMSIVDVKASDNRGNIFQIEIQLFVSNSLRQRIVHNWAEIYSRQLNEGDSWRQLKPVIAIWLVNKDIFKDFTGFHSCFNLYDVKNKLKLTEHANIHVIELCKWNKSQVENDLDRWTRFFREGKNLSDSHLPQYMLTEEMEQAMAILKQFSEKESAYDRYRARINYLRDQITMEEEKELAKAETEQAKVETEQAKVETEQAKVETEQAKVETEQAKVETEQAKVEAEQAKVKAEQAKVKAEQAKVKAEQAKVKAEQAKVDTKKAEEARKQLEVELKQANIEIEKLKQSMGSQSMGSD